MAAKLARSQRGAARAAPASAGGPLNVGDLLAGKYRVTRVLGEGGMGVVVEAYHELLDQRVAVKLLYHDIADREAQSRLLLEARSAAKLQSEHVGRVIDVDVGPDGLPFIVMELLEGADLCQIADARGALPRWLVVDYVLQALEGLAHAHGRGIIHRDLKPSNLFLANRPDGSQLIKILDFGISKSVDQAPDRRTAQLTGGRSVLGSPPYMSPEQVRSPKTVDHRTDIWSLGVCMYELLTNSMPFGGDEIQETFAQILERQPNPIRALVTCVPEALEAVVMKCLAKNRDDRYGDVGELARALVPFGSGTWIQAADRVHATLARAAIEEASGARARVSTSDRISLPALRKNESMQPELHGTTSTLARRYTLFEPTPRRRAILGFAAFAAVLGAGLIAMGYVRHRHAFAPSAPALAATQTEALPPPAVVDITAPPSATVATASIENELPGSPLPSPTFLGASPAPIASSASVKKPARVAPRPVEKKPAPSASSHALPPGLPQSRSGQ
jgi:eukaryotic-like serine/threonine-protein kinase